MIALMFSFMILVCTFFMSISFKETLRIFFVCGMICFSYLRRCREKITSIIL